MAGIFDWLLVFMRASGFLMILPLFSGGYVSVRMRVTMAGLLGMMVAPGIVNPVDLGDLRLFQLVMLIFREVTLGLFLGFICRLIFYAVELAGHIMSTDMSLQMSTLLTPDNPMPVAIPGVVMNLLATALFVTLDIHLLLILAFQRTYEVLPLGGGILSELLLENVTMRAGGVFLVGVQIAAPLMAVSFMVSLVLMMLGRAVPQMNVFFLSFTVRIMAGLAIFGVSVRLGAQLIADSLRRLPEDILGIARVLGG
jgi:flagellar biosynthesis protein FliR